MRWQLERHPHEYVDAISGLQLQGVSRPYAFRYNGAKLAEVSANLYKVCGRCVGQV